MKKRKELNLEGGKHNYEESIMIRVKRMSEQEKASARKIEKG